MARARGRWLLGMDPELVRAREQLVTAVQDARELAFGQFGQLGVQRSHRLAAQLLAQSRHAFRVQVIGYTASEDLVAPTGGHPSSRGKALSGPRS